LGRKTDKKEMSGKKVHMQLQCPVDQMDFEIVTLGHGSGGRLTHQLLDKMVFSILSNDLLDVHHDGAVLDLERYTGKAAFTTDSFVVSPVFFPGGNIGDLAVNGTVNDLAMCGAIPEYLSLAFILEEGLTMQEFWDVLLSVKKACDEAGVRIVTGDTKVVERGKGDRIFINTTGLGRMHPKAGIALQNVRAGDRIIVSGDIASHGMAIMSVREGLEFESAILSDTANLNHTVSQLLDEFGQDIHLFRDPTRGGVATVLAEIAQSSGLGIDLDESALPVDGQVAAACEILGLDPLYVASEGIFIAVVSASSASALLENLKGTAQGTNASIIGEVVEDHCGHVVMKSALGGRRPINMLTGEQLPRIC
jgi:hydrogenase expression/formation protein HypE